MFSHRWDLLTNNYVLTNSDILFQNLTDAYCKIKVKIN